MDLEEIFSKMKSASIQNAQNNNLHRSVSSSGSERDAGASANALCTCGGNGGIYFAHVNARGISNNRRVFESCAACNPKNQCTRCDGTGDLIRFNLQTLRDDIFPGACACSQLEKRVAMLNDADIPERFLDAEFGLLNPGHMTSVAQTKMTQIQETIFKFCATANEIILNKQPDKPFLLMFGPVGTGKTFLGCAALKRMTRHYGHASRFVDFLVLLSKLRDSYSKKKSEEDILAPLRSIPVLLIDELGKGRTENEWQLEKLDDLINSRYNAGKVTILTTNYLPPEIAYDPAKFGLRSTPANESFWQQSLPERIGSRMYDRLLESCVMTDFMHFESFRRRNAQEFFAGLVKKNI